MHCLADTELIQLVDGSLPAGLAASLEAHIDVCERCFQILASVLRGQSSRSLSADRSLPLPAEPAPPSEEAPGASEIGRRYLLLSLLGQGGMGRVYRAFDRLSGKEVALKRVLRGGLMPPDVARTTVLPQAEPVSYARCLEQEFRLLATLRHPNIISVLDYGFDDQLQPYFTMELLDGAQPILPFALALSLPARVELLIQFLHALGYLHRRGILHRDFNSRNCVVFSPGWKRRGKAAKRRPRFVSDRGSSCKQPGCDRTDPARHYGSRQLGAGRA